jgi:hypothetical protein
MTDTQASTGMRDNLLVGWKEIAAYMKCSVRKVQRLEHAGLPVNRIPGAKSVWASRPDVDGWLTVQAEESKQQAKTRPKEETASRRPSSTAIAVQLSIMTVLLLLTVRTWIASAYGLTTLLFSMTASIIVMSHRYLPNRRWARAPLGLFLIAGMAYATTATSLPGIVDSIANMEILRPALAYPVVAGLRFIPGPIALCVFWILTAFRSDSTGAQKPAVARAFAGVGVGLLCTAAGTGLLAFVTNPIWQSHLSIRWTLLAGELSILAFNAGLVWLGYRFLIGQRGELRQFFAWCGTVCLLIALIAATMGKHWNDINKRYLDVRQLLEYRVGNSNALADLHNWLQRHPSQAGPELMRLPDDPEFIEALQHGKFYRVRFDEPFQFSSKAVVLGYRAAHTAQEREDGFRLIRFPAELANTLRLK